MGLVVELMRMGSRMERMKRAKRARGWKGEGSNPHVPIVDFTAGSLYRHWGRVIGYEIDYGPAVTTSSHVNCTRDAARLKIMRSHHFTDTHMYEDCYISYSRAKQPSTQSPLKKCG